MRRATGQYAAQRCCDLWPAPRAGTAGPPRAGVPVRTSVSFAAPHRIPHRPGACIGTSGYACKALFRRQLLFFLTVKDPARIPAPLARRQPPSCPAAPEVDWTPPPTKTPAASNRALPAGERPPLHELCTIGSHGGAGSRGSEPSYWRPLARRQPPSCARGEPRRRRPAAPAAVHAAQL